MPGLLHLLDANVLITAHRNYYPIDRVPEFWEWLLHHGTEGNLKMPLEIVDEICSGTDDLADWLSDRDHIHAIQLDEEVDAGFVQQVIAEGYASDLNDIEIETVGRDPFLIAYAIQDVARRCVVTTEVSATRRQRANRKIPDICHQFGIGCHDSFGLIRNLDFSTSWRERLS